MSATMDGPGIKFVKNETENQAKRISNEGKAYTYKLKVIQQPLRARACGAGAKCKFLLGYKLANLTDDVCSVGGSQAC